MQSINRTSPTPPLGRLSISAGASLAWLAGAAWLTATPEVRLAATFTHASVTDPIEIDIAADGTIFTGRDNSGSGGRNDTAARIHRIASGGNPVDEFGDTAPTDPDTVLIDRAGNITGVPGTVLVGGAGYVTGAASGLITAFSPAGVSSVFLSLPESVSNPSSLTTDLQGQLVFVGANQAWTSAKIVRVIGTTLTYPVSMSRPSQVAIDSLGRFVVSSSADANIRVFDPAGTLVTTLPIGMSDTVLATAKGGFWGTATYMIDGDKRLVRMETNGTLSVIGSGFGQVYDLIFGDDDCLYLTEFANDRVLRIEPLPQLTITAARPTQLSLAAARGKHYRVEYSSTMAADQWTPLSTVTVTTYPQAVTDPDSESVSSRFYRASEVK